MKAGVRRRWARCGNAAVVGFGPVLDQQCGLAAAGRPASSLGGQRPVDDQRLGVAPTAATSVGNCLHPGASGGPRAADRRHPPPATAPRWMQARMAMSAVCWSCSVDQHQLRRRRPLAASRRRARPTHPRRPPVGQPSFDAGVRRDPRGHSRKRRAAVRPRPLAGSLPRGGGTRGLEGCSRRRPARD